MIPPGAGAALAPCARARELELAAQGKPKCTIIVEAKADAAEEQVASKPAVLERVRTTHLLLWQVEIAQAAAAVQGGGDPAALVERFDAIARKAGVMLINEWQTYDAWLASVRAIAGTRK